MGCMCSRQEDIMDATFEVKATPGAVKNRLVARATWSHLIPVSLSRYNSIPSASLYRLKSQ